jgi:hypothetical protein
MRLRNLLLAAGLVACLVSFGFALSSASAGPLPVKRGAEAALPQSAFQPRAVDNSLCLSCHTREGFTVVLDSGETLPLTINADGFQASVHGANEVACISCHTDITSFPHPDRTVNSLRDVTLKYYTSCQECHAEQFNLTLDSVHQRALAAGNTNAAVCADCHNPHTQKRMTNPDTGELLAAARLHVPETCAKCHSAIYDTYKQSVHGSALTQDGNPDVPTCIDCHGVHNIQDPTTATFRNSTPYLCANCHTNATLMRKYGLSTQVLNTYVADFHGTTVEIFNKDFPDQPTNKPVCTDCHGVHDIARVDDPAKGLAVRENLLKRCQACHPDATANFPDAWLSHYIPAPDKYPIVYYVNLFYKFLIPGVLVPMGILVVMDFTRKMINLARKPKPGQTHEAPLAPVETKVEPESAAPAEVQAESVEPVAAVEEVMTEAEAAPEMPQVEDAEPSPAPEEQTDGEQPSMTPDESKNDSEEAPHD